MRSKETPEGQAQTVGIKELRAHLKRYLEMGRPLVVRKGRTKVAVILPTGLRQFPDGKDTREAVAQMRKFFREQVEPAILDWSW